MEWYSICGSSGSIGLCLALSVIIPMWVGELYNMTRAFYKGNVEGDSIPLFVGIWMLSIAFVLLIIAAIGLYMSENSSWM